MQLSIVVGNPKPRSRTLLVAEAMAERVAHTTGAVVSETIDLIDYAAELFAWPNSGLEALSDSAARSEFLVVASPTYKAAYTGLLKAFLDRYATDGLAGVTALPVMTGGSAAHSMVIDTALRPVLVELGASVPTRGLYFEISQIDRLDVVVDEWAERNSPFLRAAAGLELLRSER
jgi:FMN reductase